jgi:outer membrane protein assembly factor BamE
MLPDIITDLARAGQRAGRIWPPANAARPDILLGRTMRRTLMTLALLATLACVAGCGMVRGFTVKPYRINVQQGNYLEEDEVDQIQPGMTRSQVRFLLGTPMVADLFNTQRWDYVYYLKVGRTREVFRRHFIVYFEGDEVVRIEKDLGNTAPPA